MVSVRSIFRRMDNLIILVIVFYFILYFGISCYSPYINLYFVSKGIPTSEIGILSTVLPFVALLLPNVWAHFADKTQNAKLFVFILIAGAGSSALLYLIGNSFMSFAAITLIYAIFACCVTSMTDVVAITICQRLQYKFSFIRISGTLGYAIGCLVLSKPISGNLYMSFIFMAICYAIALVLLTKIPKVKPPVPIQTEENPKKISLFSNKSIIFALLLLMSIYMSASFYNSFLGILLQDKNMPATFLGTCMFLSALGEVPVLYLAPKLVHRFGEIPLMAFSGVVMVIRMLLVTSGNIPIIILMQCIQGWSYMLNFYCGAMYIDSLVHPQLKAKGQTVINTVQVGVGSILGNVIGGSVSETIGLSATYHLIGLLGFGIVMVTMICFFLYNRKQSRLEPQK